MMMSTEDHRRVAEAVKAAESGTTGEIFCIVTHEVSQYRETPLAWGAAVALILPPLVLSLVGVPTLLDLFDRLQSTGWATGATRVAASEALSVYALVQAVLFTLTAFIAAIPPVRRALTPRFLKQHRVKRQAYAHFASTGLAGDPERTGVLIFASLADRHVEIVADQGIHDAVGDPVWTAACAELVSGMKRRKPGDGFVQAIATCGAALKAHFPAEGPHDNRFSDELVEI